MCLSIIKNSHMQKIYLVSLLSFCLMAVGAQSKFTLSEGSMIYALPKTELCFELEVETQTEKPGVFYQYSQRYLATNQVVTEEKTTAKVVGIKMSQITKPDLNRRFSVDIQPKQSSSIVVNQQGVLCGVNVAVPQPTDNTEDVHSYQAPKSNTATSGLLPLTQEYMMAGSIAKMAEGAAIQIYNIRMSRLNLLSGEVDIMPDGQALALMLEKLNCKEQELTELFTGTIRKETNRYKVYMSPDMAVTNDILFRLSARRGVVPQDDLSGTPYFITVNPETITTQAKDPKAKSEVVGLYTVLPASTAITVTDGVNTLLQQTVEVPQLGKLVGFPASVVLKPHTKITVDPNTGRLLGVER